MEKKGKKATIRAAEIAPRDIMKKITPFPEATLMKELVAALKKQREYLRVHVTDENNKGSITEKARTKRNLLAWQIAWRGILNSPSESLSPDFVSKRKELVSGFLKELSLADKLLAERIDSQTSKTGFSISELAINALKKDLNLVDLSALDMIASGDTSQKCIVKRGSSQDLVFIFCWLEFNGHFNVGAQSIPSFLATYFHIKRQNGNIDSLNLSSLSRYQSSFNGSISHSGTLSTHFLKMLKIKFPSIFSIKK